MKFKRKIVLIVFVLLIISIVSITGIEKELNLQKVMLEEVTESDYDYTIVAKVYDENIYKSQLDMFKNVYLKKSGEEVLRDLIISRLLKLEANKMNISISDNELTTFINNQRDSIIKDGNESTEAYIRIKDICEKMVITMEEYYDLPDVREAYEIYLIKKKLINAELSKQDKKVIAEDTIAFVKEFKNELYEKAKDKIIIY